MSNKETIDINKTTNKESDESKQDIISQLEDIKEEDTEMSDISS